ncbi:MAG TPA: hypothetical protein VGV92_08325 [Gammaproteobacteria bacterium]|nr:hypothetical protein [Gammaproteobacteria bacterium]
MQESQSFFTGTTLKKVALGAASIAVPALAYYPMLVNAALQDERLSTVRILLLYGVGTAMTAKWLYDSSVSSVVGTRQNFYQPATAQTQRNYINDNPHTSSRGFGKSKSE